MTDSSAYLIQKQLAAPAPGAAAQQPVRPAAATGWTSCACRSPPRTSPSAACPTPTTICPRPVRPRPRPLHRRPRRCLHRPGDARRPEDQPPDEGDRHRVEPPAMDEDQRQLRQRRLHRSPAARRLVAARPVLRQVRPGVRQAGDSRSGRSLPRTSRAPRPTTRRCRSPPTTSPSGSPRICGPR